MPLAALIIADEEHHGSALPLVLGLPIVEYQARLAQQAGANHIVVVTAQVAAGLVSALDRLRAQGLNVALARTAREAADLVHPDETILLFDAGCVPGAELLAGLAAGDGMRIVTFPLSGHSPDRELIDADHAWAGLARIEGRIVRKTAEILGDWALAPTLLRFAVQAGAGRTKLDEGPNCPLWSVKSTADAAWVTSALVGGQQERVSGLAGIALGPVSGLIAAQAARVGLPPFALELLTAIILLAGVCTAISGWVLTALLLIPIGALAGLAASRLGRAALGQSKYFRHFYPALAWVGRLALIATGYGASVSGWGWGSIVVSLWLVWELWQAGGPKKRFDPDEISACVITALGLAAGSPVAGLALALAHGLIWRISALIRRQP